MISEAQRARRFIEALNGEGFWLAASIGEQMGDEVYRIEIPIDVVDRTEPALSRARAKVSAFEQQMIATEQRLRRVGGGLTAVGRTMTRNVTLPILAVGAGAIKTAIDFETAFAGVRKTVDATERQFLQLERGIRAMARRLPASTTEIASVAEAAGQLGVQREQILSFTETMIAMGVTTDLTSDMAATAFARIANIMQEPQRNFERMASAVVDLGNKGAATEAEIVSMALNMAGAARTIGMSTPDVLALSEALSSIGISAEAGGSAFSRVLLEMAVAVDEQGRGLRNFAATAGISTAEFTRAFEQGGTPALIAFVEGLARMRDEGGPVFQTLDALKLGEIRVRRALLGAAGAGDMFAKSVETGNAAWRENNALNEEAEKRYATQASQLKVIWNQLKDIGITIGRDLMPVVRDAAEIVRDWLQTFRELDPETRRLFIKGALALAVIGPIARVFGTIFNTLAGIVRLVRVLRTLRAGTAIADAVGTGLPGAAGGAARGGLLRGLASRIAGLGARGALAAGGIAAGAAGALLVPIFLAERGERTRRGAAQRDIEQFGLRSERGRTARRVLGVGRSDLEARTAEIRRLRELEQEQGSLTIEDERQLRSLLRARGQILKEINDLREAERNKVREQIEPLQQQLSMLDTMNGKLKASEQMRVNALIVEGKYAQAVKIVRGAIDRANQAYADTNNAHEKIMDGMQAWTSSSFAVERKTNDIKRAMRELKRWGTDSLLALVDAYGNVEDAARAALIASQAPLDPFVQAQAGGGGGRRRRRTRATGAQDAGGDYRVRGPGTFSFDVGPITEDVVLAPRSGGGARRGGGGKTVLVNVNDGAVRVTFAGDLDERSAARLADQIARHIADSVDEALGNTA